MEVKERPGPPREIAALALPQLGELAQFPQQFLYVIKVFLRCVPHPSSMARPAKARQAPANTRWSFPARWVVRGENPEAGLAAIVSGGHAEGLEQFLEVEPDHGREWATSADTPRFRQF
jgi:hypothetical protein